MKKYEYKLMTIVDVEGKGFDKNSILSIEKEIEFLNVMGEEGWLFLIYLDVSKRYVFVREIQQNWP